MRFRDFPIRRKLMLVGVLSSGLALLLASGAFVAYEAVTFRRALVQQGFTHAQLVGESVAAAVVFDDRAAARATLGALRADPRIVAAAVYDADGTLFATYVRAGTEATPWFADPPPGAGRWSRFVDGALVVAKDLVVDEERVGAVRVVSDLGEEAVRRRSYLGIVVATFLVSILGAAMLSARLQRAISGPILHLVDRARVVSEEKNYAIRATPSGRDEVGLLVETFNDMLAQIQARAAALEGARDDAERANRAKDEFLAVVSHEFRTPLTPIITWTRLLKGGIADPAAVTRALDVIERNARSQAQLVDDLLDVSRIIAGKMRLDVQQVDLRPIVEAAAESLRPAAEAKEIGVQLVLDPGAGMVTGDAERLRQVCWNLLSNAVKFTPRGGHVEVQPRRVSSHVEIRVSDAGQGIRPEFLPFVFERFRQADSTTTRFHGGLGLGLAIVRHIVELHGGRVGAHSAGEGQGATFVVELPLRVLEGTPIGERERRTAPAAGGVPFVPTPSLGGLRVLVVDDEADTLETIRVTSLAEWPVKRPADGGPRPA